MFDPSKPVQTRDGRPARILCTDRQSDLGYTIVALIDGKDVATFTPEGHYVVSNGVKERDLINVPPPKQTFWVNVYSDDRSPSYVYATRELADKAAWKDYRIACVKVTEGDGL